jgi:RES domain-containing protein
MLRGDALRSAVAHAPLAYLDGPWLRGVDADLLTKPPPGFPARSRPQPLWGGGAKLKGGRFTPKGSFETLYLASDLLTLGMEMDKVFPRGGATPGAPLPNPFTTVHVAGRVRNVLDLTSAATRRKLGTTVAEITAPWRLEPDPITHELARAAVESRRILAILAPSAANRRRGTILALFTQLLPLFPPSHVECEDSSGRLAQRLP